jgi:hypothetical protein
MNIWHTIKRWFAPCNTREVLKDHTDGLEFRSETDSIWQLAPEVDAEYYFNHWIGTQSDPKRYIDLRDAMYELFTEPRMVKIEISPHRFVYACGGTDRCGNLSLVWAIAVET